ncbi:MAG TPA: DUF58 domain-containing protein [Polyangiaceae bacterium]|nr:MAG: hypothetical protein BWY17_03712 [Deltaproteobacteria bacterium ADurb.Bin207]HNZ23446.1 DUF58 domain-containing protein [Polyangiaceae bacterium]HOD23724.1 DUF58 domain-containing protein [Polyangiaceae bacterium]HOE49970.1 DUF58 domain-containing protein [Polyangiaceae bacterium]HOH01700.1 DUF58 domain-containing protein [Polyangiaceae bacterium]
MHIYPTRPAVHVAFAGAVVLLAGVIGQRPPIIAWGAAILIALVFARAAALVSVSRIRNAGFEMVWSEEKKVVATVRGAEVELAAEVRNRDNLAARYVHLRPVASSHLLVSLEPTMGEVPAGGRLHVTVRVQTPRVGRHAIHGLSLEVQGAPGLFEVPLTFANPYGIEVLPRPFSPLLLSARGGRSRREAELGRPGPMRGDGVDLRELRELLPGDSFKRIAWRASARRGKLIVREFEHDERDVVWLVLDASVEHWAGVVGKAPLDYGIDEVAAAARKHLGRGDSVGLAVFGGRLRGLLEPDRGPRHAHHIALALTLSTATYDADRSELEEREVAARVLEHIRPLEPKFGRIKKYDLDRLAFHAEAAMSRAPFRATTPEAPTQREQSLRKYLAAFGIESPARSDSEKIRTEEAMNRFFGRLAKRKPRPSLVHVWAPGPDYAKPEFVQALSQLRRVGATIRWTTPRVELPADPRDSVMAQAVTQAVLLRSHTARKRAERVLARMGVRMQRIRRYLPAESESP